jgi:hypothetical protein
MKKLIVTILVSLTSCTSEFTERALEKSNSLKMKESIKENIICMQKDNLCLCCNDGHSGCSMRQSASVFQTSCDFIKSFEVRIYKIEDASR